MKIKRKMQSISLSKSRHWVSFTNNCLDYFVFVRRGELLPRKISEKNSHSQWGPSTAVLSACLIVIEFKTVFSQFKNNTIVAKHEIRIN